MNSGRTDQPDTVPYVPVHSEEPLPRRANVLVVDDEDGVQKYFVRLLTAEGYNVAVAADGLSALEAIANHPPDVVLLDVNIPGLSGFEVCRRVRREASTRLLPIIFVTGLGEREQRVEGLAAGADDFLTKPVDNDELLARVRSLVRMKQFTDDLDSASNIIMILATMIEARDGHSEGHCHRVANLATSLGRALNLGDAELQALYRGGFLHDIGMLAISDSVLRKDGPLDSAEFELVKSHTIVGDTLCGHLQSLRSIRPIVRHHHERLDGSGYPDGLRGDQVPLLAQIMGVIDVYEALTNERPYQPAKSSEEAIGVLRSHVERGWRAHDLVEAFVSLVHGGALDKFTSTPPASECDQARGPSAPPAS
jgi:putative two-component system response regulator